MIALRDGLLAGATVVVMATAASAQPSLGTTTPHRGTVEVGGGVTWTGGYDAGSADATLSRNGTAGSPPLTLFTLSSRVPSVAGGQLRAGIYLARRVSVDVSFAYSRPTLRAHVTGDFESAADTDANETITSYLAGGSLLYHFGSGRFVPFVSAGGGYLRQLHEANADLLTGTDVHGGGGLKYWLGTGAHRFGIRVEAQATSHSKSVAFEQKRRVVPSAGVGITYLF